MFLHLDFLWWFHLSCPFLPVQTYQESVELSMRRMVTPIYFDRNAVLRKLDAISTFITSHGSGASPQITISNSSSCIDRTSLNPSQPVCWRWKKNLSYMLHISSFDTLQTECWLFYLTRYTFILFADIRLNSKSHLQKHFLWFTNSCTWKLDKGTSYWSWMLVWNLKVDWTKGFYLVYHDKKSLKVLRACLQSWLAPKALGQKKKWDKIDKLRGRLKSSQKLAKRRAFVWGGGALDRLRKASFKYI